MKPSNMNNTLRAACFALVAAATVPAADEDLVLPAMIGGWQGDARLSDTVTFPVTLTIAGDGGVIGTIGGATLGDGRFARNRGALARALNLKTDYIVTGRLDGAIGVEANEAATRAMIPLQWTDGRFSGTVHGVKTWLGFTTPVISARVALAPAARPPPATVAAERVGIYDSRIVSFAHFWSEPARQERDALIAAAKAAKAAADTARFKALEQRIVAEQNRSHLQVFSTAPADEAMAALKDKLPAIQKELGVARFVSRWDEAALDGVPEANRIDATDRLAREFAPDEKRQKTIEQMKKAKPLPLDEATRLMEAGKL